MEKQKDKAVDICFCFPLPSERLLQRLVHNLLEGLSHCSCSHQSHCCTLELIEAIMSYSHRKLRINNGTCALVLVCVLSSPVGEREGVRGRGSGSARSDEAAGQPGCSRQQQTNGGSGSHPGHGRGPCFIQTEMNACAQIL